MLLLGVGPGSQPRRRHWWWTGGDAGLKAEDWEWLEDWQSQRLPLAVREKEEPGSVVGIVSTLE